MNDVTFFYDLCSRFGLSDPHQCHNILLILGTSEPDVVLDLLKPQNADKILIKIADLGNACWVVSNCSTNKVTTEINKKRTATALTIDRFLFATKKPCSWCLFSGLLMCYYNY